MLRLDSVSRIYRSGDVMQVKAVDNVSLDIELGEFIVITGRSGSGKTTLLSMMGGLARPTSGRVLFNGLDIWTLDDRELSRLRNERIGFLFQFFSLIPTLNVKDNLRLPAIFQHARFDTDKRSEEVLEMVELTHKIHAYPSQLSGGEQRRIALARSLINRPDILLADEPTGDLDEETEIEVMNVLHRLNREGLTIVMVTHNTDLIHYSTRHLKMSSGQVIQI
ncbi:MAG: ABC transporter ATP-binding protein [Thaumarchaeota archaeon]|nr:ABC transporter ATP-binding protein [Nitrososphaerota archaeon]MCL5317129.1 ABC transporter ATP-binding protein [Nitrososphaerota archaeon]